MSRINHLLHLREVQRLNGGTIYKPLETKSDFNKVPSDITNLHIDESHYLDLINDNPDYYFLNRPNKITSDIDTLAFLGLKIESDDSSLSSSASVIPFGDLIVSSFTIDKIEYLKTYTGFFMKKKQSPKIEVCSSERYYLAKSFLTLDQINHVELHENLFYKNFKSCDSEFPQAGLTRGSNGTFSPSEKSLSKIEKIKEKYKNGIK